jgi:hypothetical protein
LEIACRNFPENTSFYFEINSDFLSYFGFANWGLYGTF